MLTKQAYIDLHQEGENEPQAPVSKTGSGPTASASHVRRSAGSVLHSKWTADHAVRSQRPMSVTCWGKYRHLSLWLFRTGPQRFCHGCGTEAPGITFGSPLCGDCAETRVVA